MTVKKFKNQQEEKQSEVGVWFCESCGGFHMKAGNVLLTFSPSEFSNFTSSVIDCYSQNALLEDFSKVH